MANYASYNEKMAHHGNPPIDIVDMLRSADIGFTGEHRRMNVAYSRARFFTITVASYNSVNEKLAPRGNPAIYILRNSDVRMDKGKVRSCVACLGASHKSGMCNAILTYATLRLTSMLPKLTKANTSAPGAALKPTTCTDTVSAYKARAPR
ncbi:universal stress protein family domain protein [Apiospora arundinis]